MKLQMKITMCSLNFENIVVCIKQIQMQILILNCKVNINLQSFNQIKISSLCGYSISNFETNIMC